jgi:hypothetical protein
MVVVFHMFPIQFRFLPASFFPFSCFRFNMNITMSETRQSSPSDPHLPTEIFFHILSSDLIDPILRFRTLCRAVRDEIDTRVLFSYIRRTKLLSFPVPNDIDDEFLEPLDLRALSGGIATFSHLEPRFSNVPIWTRTHAVFRFDAE